MWIKSLPSGAAAHPSLPSWGAGGGSGAAAAGQCAGLQAVPSTMPWLCLIHIAMHNMLVAWHGSTADQHAHRSTTHHGLVAARRAAQQNAMEPGKQQRWQLTPQRVKPCWCSSTSARVHATCHCACPVQGGAHAGGSAGMPPMLSAPAQTTQLQGCLTACGSTQHSVQKNYNDKGRREPACTCACSAGAGGRGGGKRLERLTAAFACSRPRQPLCSPGKAGHPASRYVRGNAVGKLGCTCCSTRRTTHAGPEKLNRGYCGPSAHSILYHKHSNLASKQTHHPSLKWRTATSSSSLCCSPSHFQAH